MTGKRLRKKILIFSCFFFLVFSFCSTNNNQLFAGENKIKKTTISESKKNIRDAFKSGNLIVKDAAIRMLKYVPEKDVYTMVLAVFQNFSIENTYPGFLLLWDSALATLYHLDPGQTLALLKKNQEMVLISFDLFKLFSVIGFDKVSLFDNIVDFHATNWIFSEHSGLFDCILIAELYIQTSLSTYKKDFESRRFGRFPPGELLFLYNYLKDKKLLFDNLIVSLKAQEGLNTQDLNYMNTLDEILSRALLFRLGIIKSVYLNNTIYENGREKGPNPGSFKECYTIEYSYYTFSPSFIIKDCLAYFYAGVPGKRHAESFLSVIKEFPELQQYKFIQIILDSPGNVIKQSLINGFIQSDKTAIRRMVAASMLDQKTEYSIKNIHSWLEKEEDIAIKSMLLEICRNTRTAENIGILTEYIRDPDPLLSVTAAGQLLLLAGESK